MFDEELPKSRSNSYFPRNIEALSVSDLQEYIVELEFEIEIEIVKSDIVNKKVSQNAAASFFK